MQRGHKLLIIGAAILTLGLILTMTIFVILKQTSFSINTSIEMIPPGKSILKTSDFNKGTKMAIAVNSQPSDVPINVQVIQEPDLAKILDVNFSHSLFTNFMPKKDGVDTIMVTNLGSKQVSTNTVFGNSEFFDSNGQPKIILGTAAIAGLLLSFIGIVVLIIGGIFLLIDRRRGRRKKYQE